MSTFYTFLCDLKYRHMFMYHFIRDFLCDFLYEILREKTHITTLLPELHITTPLPELQKFFPKKIPLIRRGDFLRKFLYQSLEYHQPKDFLERYLKAF